MDTPIEERYVFLRSCNSDFAEVVRLLDDAESQPQNIAYPLLRFAVIVYFRSFTYANTRFLHNQQDGSQKKRIRLERSIIPDEFLSFHDELKTYRDSAYAHSDIAARNPRLFHWPSSQWEFPISLSPVDKKPLHIHKDKLRQLCEIANEWVVRELRKLEDNFRVQPL